MALLKVITYGHPVLRQQAAEVNFSKVDPKFLDDLIETMHEEDGVGLAAPQVGIAKRIISAGDGENWHTVINPKIISHSILTEKDHEGCLSLPGLRGEVSRFRKITVKGLDRDGNPIEIKARGLLSRVFQHEIDHLDGTLFIDRAEKNSLNWVDWQDGKNEPEYIPTDIPTVQRLFRNKIHSNRKNVVFDRNE
ncbi:peptide deformylase [bacterium]|nr:peptide deformylase [bacterium]